MTTKSEELLELKELLIKAIEDTADWRMQKAEEDTEQAETNKAAADELTKLCEYIETEIPVDHELFFLEQMAIEKNNDDLMHDLRIMRNNEIRKHGFESHMEPCQWVEEQILELNYLIKHYR